MHMPGFISRLLDRGAAKAGIRGFTFASLADGGEWARAASGQVIRNPSPAPPWIVVAHTLNEILGVGWPGRLWEVEILEEAPEQPLNGAQYTRAVAVRVRHEVPVATLFPNGEDVLRVIERAASLQASDVPELAFHASDEAAEAYSRAWNAWLAKVDPGSIHHGSDHRDTLAVFAGRKSSPVGIAFTVLYEVLGRRAREIAGDAAFEEDEEGERWFTGPWADASRALLCAVMAFGAPELTTDADRRLLLRAWNETNGARDLS
jgi:hypothetical protein